MKKVQRVSSGAVWEDIVGYSRAIRVGNVIEVAGTTAVNEEGKLIGLGDPYKQAIFIIQKAQKALHELGADLKDVIRTRVYTTDISQWEEIGKAHGEFFKEVKPAATMIEVSKLISPDILVEIEFSAMV